MFGAPLFLLGALAAGVPLVLHLVYRRRAQTLPFPSLKFLRTTTRRTAHRRRLQELLLLAIRMALVTLLALALARPFLRAPSAASGSSSTSVALVLDDSYSMAARVGRTSAWARAKRAAGHMLDRLGSGAFRGLFLASGEAGSGAGLLTSDAAAVGEGVHAAEVGDLAGDLAEAIRRAHAAFEENDDADREIVVLTDFARVALPDLRAAAAALEDKRFHVIFIDCAPSGSAPNAGVTGVAVATRARAVGGPVRIECVVRNWSDAAMNETLTLHLDGRKVESRTLELAPDSAVELAFTHPLPGTGTHTGFFEIGEDALAADNRRYFQIEVAERTPVAVVGPEASAGAARTSAHFVARALDPAGALGADDAASGGPVEVRAVGADELAHLDLSSVRAVFLCDLVRPSKADAARLARFAEAGGGLFIIPPPDADPKVYADAFGVGGEGEILPARLAARLEAGEGLGVRDAEASHPLLAPFRGAEAALFESVRVRTGWRIEIPHGSEAAAVLTLENGYPLLAARRFGRGEVCLLACAIRPGETNLPGRAEVLVPLLHSAVHALAENAQRAREFRAGDRLRLALPAAGTGHAAAPVPVEITDTRGVVKEFTVPPPAAAAAGAGEPRVLEGDVAREAGIYRFAVKAPGGSTGAGAGTGAFAVNVDPEEADPARLSNAEVRAAFDGFLSIQVVPAEEPAIDRAVARVRTGAELTQGALTAVLALLIFECFFANLIMPGTRGRASEEGGA